VVDAEPGGDAAAAVESDLPTSLADAEEAVSQAESRAEEARARAAELRRQAAADPDDNDAADADGAEREPGRWALWRRLPRWRVRPPSRKAVEIGAAAALVSASLGASGFMVWQHISLMHEHKRATEFTEAARRGVEMMMSIDPDHARENIQRVIDNTTGTLQSQLRVSSTYIVDDAQKAKVITKATVQDAAVESLTDNSAVVLVVAQSDTTNPDKSKRPPVFWRLSITVDRDDGQPKMSKFDFVQ
jgi:Mce-associated membrane protein